MFLETGFSFKERTQLFYGLLFASFGLSRLPRLPSRPQLPLLAGVSLAACSNSFSADLLIQNMELLALGQGHL